MQAQVSQWYDQLISVMRIAMVLSGSALMAAASVGGVASSSGGNDNAAPVQLSAAAAQAPGPTEAATDPPHGSRHSPTRPTCAEVGAMASTPEIERTGESRGTDGCGPLSTLADGAPAIDRSQERVDLATLLAWHVQAHNSIAYACQTTPPARKEAKHDVPWLGMAAGLSSSRH
jgi:hypothetical protein